MAKYIASPGYVIDSGVVKIEFNYFGEYETEDSTEIKLLDKNVPRYIKRIKTEEYNKTEEQDKDDKQKPKAEEPKKKDAKKKPSAK